jgi:aminoglycoside phosphotransferase (APT) family kinase protein
LSALQAVEASGVAPKPITLVNGDRPLLIESFIDGKPFMYGPMVNDVASAISAVHRCAAIGSPTLPVTDPTMFLLQDGARWLAKADTAEKAARDARTLLRKYERALTGRAIRSIGPSVVVHTDLIHSNILTTSDGCRIVDWEGARIGPPGWDLAYFLSPVTLRWTPRGCPAMSQDQQERFVRRYADESGLDYIEVSQSIVSLMPFVVFRALAWCLGFALSSPSADRTGRLVEFTAPEFIASLGFLFE